MLATFFQQKLPPATPPNVNHADLSRSLFERRIALPGFASFINALIESLSLLAELVEPRKPL